MRPNPIKKLKELEILNYPPHARTHTYPQTQYSHHARCFFFSQLISIQFKYGQSVTYIHIQTAFLPSLVAFEGNAQQEDGK